MGDVVGEFFSWILNGVCQLCFAFWNDNRKQAQRSADEAFRDGQTKSD